YRRVMGDGRRARCANEVSAAQGAPVGGFPRVEPPQRWPRREETMRRRRRPGVACDASDRREHGRRARGDARPDVTARFAEVDPSAARVGAYDLRQPTAQEGLMGAEIV